MRLLIATRPRCGTHFLKSLLGSVPQICAFEQEIFHRGFRGNPGFWDGRTDPAEWIEANTDADRPSVFVAHPHQRGDEINVSLAKILTHVIVLYRRDLLAQYVSYRIAERSDAWITTVGTPHTTGDLTVEQDGLAQFATWMRESIEEDLNTWPKAQARKLAYEDLAGNTRGTLATVATWLNVDLSAARPATEKHELRPLWDVVTNYTEARSWAAELAIP